MLRVKEVTDILLFSIFIPDKNAMIGSILCTRFFSMGRFDLYMAGHNIYTRTRNDWPVQGF